MPDMLVKLYALPETDTELIRLRTEGVDVRHDSSPGVYRGMLRVWGNNAPPGD
jgi:hypothetical protein